MAANPASSVPDLTLSTEKAPTETVIRCSGKIVSSTSDSLKAAARAAMDGSKAVVLDFTQVTYLDSAGLGMIVGLYVTSKSHGCKLKLINLNQRIRELLSITRLAPLFEGSEMLGLTPD